MKRIAVLVLLVIFLAGCGGQESLMDRAAAFRQTLLTAQGCSFDTRITADFGDKTYTFAMACTADQQGNLSFTVSEPETIAGITGMVSAVGGKLTFDDTALAFALLADGEISPVSSPWLLIKTLRSGYLSACGMDGELIRLTIDDSYEADAMQVNVWMDGNDLPVRGEILWQGRRMITLSVENFRYL